MIEIYQMIDAYKEAVRDFFGAPLKTIAYLKQKGYAEETGNRILKKLGCAES